MIVSEETVHSGLTLFDTAVVTYCMYACGYAQTCFIRSSPESGKYSVATIITNPLQLPEIGLCTVADTCIYPIPEMGISSK